MNGRGTGIAIAMVALATGMAGCAVGPEFRPPAVEGDARYTPGELRSLTAAAPGVAGTAQCFRPGRDIPNHWWTLFRSERLDRLIRQALHDSPTLAAAQAALRQAQENRHARLGALLPSIDANLAVDRRKFTGASFGQPDTPGGLFTLYNASVSVSYSLDLFGGTRRGLEALRAETEYQRYLLEASHLTLTANIVAMAVQEASLRARLDATAEMVAAEQEQLRLVERQFQLGGAALPDVLVQRAQLAQTMAGVPPLEKELAGTRHQLAVLAGKRPNQADELPQFRLTDLELPLDLPLSLPADLVRQRPDVRASEELLHRASALVGVATANLFPRITLSADYGSQSTVLGDLFSGGTGVWSLGAALLQPIFRGGQLRAERRAAFAAYDQAEAHYRETVLLAFRNVADVLRALELDAVSLTTRADAEKAARHALDLTRKQYDFGAVGYLSLLTAQRQHQQARLGLVEAQAARLADTAALFQALGGGWWNRGTGHGAMATTHSATGEPPAL